MTADQQGIRDLEHDGTPEVPAIAPLGSNPNHCGRCSQVAATAELQAVCPHDPDDLETVDLCTFAGVVRRVHWCGACGQHDPVQLPPFPIIIDPTVIDGRPADQRKD